MVNLRKGQTVTSLKACAFSLQLLEATIIDVVEHKKVPPQFSAIQFEIFSAVKANKGSYNECVGAVEWCSKLLFSFEKVNSLVAMYVLNTMRKHMEVNSTPSDIAISVRRLLDDYDDDDVIDSILDKVDNVLAAFIIDDKLDEIRYM